MEKKKKTLLIIFGILFLLVILFFSVKAVVTNRVQNHIDEMIGKNSEYEALDVNLLQREISLRGLNYNKRGNIVHAERVSMSGIGFFDYLLKGKLNINNFTFEKPEIVITQTDSTHKKSPKNKFKQNISIGHIIANDGTFKLRKEGSTGNEIFFRFPEVAISEVSIDSTTLKNTIPLNYAAYHIASDSLRLNLNSQHFIAASKLSIDNGHTIVKDFRITPYYDKREFDQNVPYEKDRISLRVEDVELDSLNFTFKDGLMYLRNPGMRVSGGALEVYRNRELPDDPRERTLYSEMLRNAPVKLDFLKVKVSNSHIKYEEKMKTGRPPATVVFTIKNADINNITNIGLDRKDFPRTKAHVEATFQEVVPLSVDWSFNTSNTNDKFLFSGKFGKVPGNALNTLLRPSMNMEAKGKIKDAWFTFTGNSEVLTGDVRLNYDQFKFVLLKDNSREKKGLLTAIANLFVDNDGISGEEVSKEIKVNRDVHVSFWGYVWSGLKAGVKETFSQI